jgi:hypothetical protein
LGEKGGIYWDNFIAYSVCGNETYSKGILRCPTFSFEEMGIAS